ncbi:MAG: hypothetical protein HY820_10695 [Acidobacteria bacterium]|nr:hypothetical protein [Acidobacteriota bacterium]
MHVFTFLLMLAAPFWETLAPREWNDEQLTQMINDSPWAQTTTFRDGNPAPVYLASAKPMREAEAELLRRYTLKIGTQNMPDSASRREYEEFLSENEGKVVVIAIRNLNLKILAEAAEGRLMENESYLKAGRKKLKMSGHFPPTPGDPVLRLIFPRPQGPVKEITFELYMPGFTGPYRQASFRIKDLVYKGKTEM